MLTSSALISRCLIRMGARQSRSVSSHHSQLSAPGATGATDGSRGTLNEEEVNKFQNMTNQWWDPNGPAKGLHSMNDLRVPLVRDGLIHTHRVDPGATAAGAEPLAGLNILDVGCGGGLLTERLARMGAQVVGIDAAQASIDAAQAHLSNDQLLMGRIKYKLCTVEEYLAASDGGQSGKKFDAVVASEVIEHVSNPAMFVNTCSSLLSDGGSIFVTTINRTMRSYLGAILAAEYALRLLPVGTHDWNKFVTPAEVEKWLKDAGCSKIRLVHGMFYVPFLNKWTWIPDTAVNYAIHAVKVPSKTTTPEPETTDKAATPPTQS